MSVIITPAATFGPFKSIEVLPDQLRADNTDYCFTVIGNDYAISEDDSLAPPKPAPKRDIPAEIAVLELSITERMKREALLGKVAVNPKTSKTAKQQIEAIDDQIAALRTL